MRRILLIAIGIAAAVVLFVVLRPQEDEDTTTPATTTAATTAPASPTSTVEPPPPPPPPKPPVVRVTVRDGRVVGGLKKLTLEPGQRFVLIVISDVADHVHFHGLDIFADVIPGKRARLETEFDTPGRYEIELEDAGLQIVQVNVSP